MNRDRDYYRKQNKRAANRKYNILKKLYGKEIADSYLKNGSKNSLSKLKIHCSCWMCQKGEPCAYKRKELADRQVLDEYDF